MIFVYCNFQWQPHHLHPCHSFKEQSSVLVFCSPLQYVQCKALANGSILHSGLSWDLLVSIGFPGGLQLASEQREDSYHFLVFTDLFGNRTHGVVVQYYRPVQVQTHTHTKQTKYVDSYKYRQLVLIGCLPCQSCQEGAIQNGHRWNSSKTRLYTPFAVCIISKFPYYNALRDCLSW